MPVGESIGKGVSFKAGIKKQTTWGTPVTVDIGFRAISPTFEAVIDGIVDKSYNGAAFDRQCDQIKSIYCRFGFEVWLKYEGLEVFLALFAGSVARTGSGPYTNKISFLNDLAGIFFTYAFEDGKYCHTVDSCKFTEVSLAGVYGEDIKLKCSAIGRRHWVDHASNPNLNSLAEPSNIDHVKLLASVEDYEIAAQASALADFELTSWDLMFRRAIPIDDRVFTNKTAPFMKEPTAGEAEGTGSFVIPHEAMTYPTAAVTPNSPYKLKLNHYLTASKQAGVFLPHLKFTKPDHNVKDKASIPQKNDFRCERADSAPSGFDYRDPYFVFVNSNSVALL